MSKYDALWAWIRENGADSFKLTFDETGHERHNPFGSQNQINKQTTSDLLSNAAVSARAWPLHFQGIGYRTIGSLKI